VSRVGELRDSLFGQQQQQHRVQLQRDPVVLVGYKQLWMSDFETMTQVRTWDSPAATNAEAKPEDTDNKSLQTPMLAGNTFITGDANTTNGKALQCHVRKGTYQLPNNKSAQGLTAARCVIGPAFSLPGTRVEARVRSVGEGKFADMVFPTVGWHWEIDWRERFNGSMGVALNHHSDLGQAGGAKPQIHIPYAVNATEYHVYAVEFFSLDKRTVSGVAYFLDGKQLDIKMPGQNPHTVKMITDAKWLPSNPLTGVISIGSAVPPHRGPITSDAYDCFDWVQILQKN
jgi:hypothetical protein